MIRHAQSEGNKNREIHQNVPDHRVKLTPEGQQQALEAGQKLRSLLRPDDTLHFFTSPYRRTRETTEGILTSLASAEPSPSPFPRHTIKVYEEPRLREQDFGNFQPCSADMERMWRDRADYGHFFYRIPNGESAADAYDRISGFNDSLWRRFEENDFASVCVLVTHGLMTRVFLMKWYHFSVEYFEDLRNVNHCEFVVMKKDPENGKFILQNQLRTWSQLKRERAARGSISLPPNAGQALEDYPVPIRRRWGDCLEGFSHGNHPTQRFTLKPPVRQNTADLFKDNNDILTKPWTADSRGMDDRRIALDSSRSHGNKDTILDQDPEKHSLASTSKDASPTNSRAQKPKEIYDLPSLAEGLVASPNHLHSGHRQSFPSGRDGGGSKSGVASVLASSDDDDDDDDDDKDDKDSGAQPLNHSGLGSARVEMDSVLPRSLIRALRGEFGGGGDRAMADALGDQSDPEVEKTDAELGESERQADEMERIVENERRDRSLKGSVY